MYSKDSNHFHSNFFSSSGVPDVSSQHEGEDAETDSSQSALNDRFMAVIREQLAQERELQRKYHEMVCQLYLRYYIFEPLNLNKLLRIA